MSVWARKMLMLQIILFTLGAILLTIGLGVKRSLRAERAAADMSVSEYVQKEGIRCEYAEWVGYAVKDDEVKALKHDVRIIAPNMAVIMNIREDRLNIEVDDQGLVLRTYCG
jgi:hypothetical protein